MHAVFAAAVVALAFAARSVSAHALAFPLALPLRFGVALAFALAAMRCLAFGDGWRGTMRAVIATVHDPARVDPFQVGQVADLLGEIHELVRIIWETPKSLLI